MLTYAIPIVLSAFLLFLVQPLIGRFILPWFGGTPAVWTVCMLFFQLVLLCGYAYAHASISRLKQRTQGLLHLVLLLAALATLPIIPNEVWKPGGPEWAELGILALLCATVGLPLFVLSATAPLLQAWFGRRHPGVSPYYLYAFSNGASLAALIGYPFMIEPAIRLKSQAWAWSFGFACFALLCAWCALRQRDMAEGEAGAEEAPAPPVPALDRALWVVWSACGSVLLLATTSQMTQNVAVVPMLWVVPLALYLFSFVVCFAGPRWYWRPLWLVVFPLSIVGVASGQNLPLQPQVGVYCAALFSGCMICHGELVRLKPPAIHLTHYYLGIAIGGALGGLFCSLVAPLVFNGLWEYPCGLAAVCLLLLGLMCRNLGARWNLGPARTWTPFAGVVAIAVVLSAVKMQSLREGVVVASRNFYGVLTVGERTGTMGPERALFHGQIWHGLQFFNENLRRVPVAYYGTESGLGLAESLLRTRNGADPAGRALRIGGVGLGAGILAAYGREGDTVRFYEINPEVVRLANEYFTYLSDTPAEVEMILGDARISLERERTQGRAQRFDLLVLDAFSGDAVPMHLLSREAFALYDQHLASDGVLAVHISNQHLDMAPLIFGLARDADRQAVLIDQEEQANNPTLFSSSWVLVTRESLLKNRAVASRAASPGDPADWLCFTDDYSNLLQLILKTPRAE